MDIIKWLIEEQGANINLGNDGHTPLLIATNQGHIEAMYYLISKGANVNLAATSDCRDNYERDTSEATTPLHQTLRYGQVQAAKILIENKTLIKKSKGLNPV